MPFVSPLGFSDFRELRESGATFIDKSQLIIDFLDSNQKVLLLPRPRRFGKTLNLSMLRYFLEKRPENLAPLFEDLHVFRCERAALYKEKHFQRYPVIFISFKDIRGQNFELCHQAIVDALRILFGQHSYVLESAALDSAKQEDFRSVRNGSAPSIRYRRALADLCAYIHLATGQKPIVLVDEYDQPIHNGWLAGYGAAILDFFRDFLGSALKDNPHLERAVLTGILRIAKESIFSGLNNLAVYTLLDRPFSKGFGFHEDEVRSLMELAGHPEWMPLVQAWYDGYWFFDQAVYNPWSVLSFLSNHGAANAYWLNTSSNDLIRHVLQNQALHVSKAIELLIEGGSVDTQLSPNTVLEELHSNEKYLWSLLTFSGYLRAEQLPITDPLRLPVHRLRIPNVEVRLIYTEVFESWLRSRMRRQGAALDILLSAMFGGDAELFEEQLQAFVMNALSFHDGSPTEPEAIYQAFILGLLCILEPEYRVRSNRESGRGRPDVMIVPTKPGKPGVVLELKAVRRGTLEQALEKALKQIRERDYPAELRAMGAEPVYAFALAFDGKNIQVAMSEDIQK